MTIRTEVAMKSISIADINAGIDDEPRIQDIILADQLGFSRARKIRDIIKANHDELSSYSKVCTETGQTSSVGGRPSLIYWLNEPQALLICMFSRTPKAEDVRRQIITVFMDYRRAKADEKSVAVRAHQRRTSTKIDKAISLAETAARLELAADRLDVDGEDGSLADEPLRAAGDDTPVTLGNLLDMLREANRRMHGGRATSTRYEIALIETVSETIAASETDF